MTPPMDPAECPWTPEGEELRSDQQARYTEYLDLLSEDEDYELIQFPQRFSHQMTNTSFPPVSDTISTFKSIDWAEMRERARAGVNNIGLVLAVLGEKLHEAGCYLAEL